MSFSCTDKDSLIAYIYDECDAATRGAVDVHLASCPACAAEVSGFGIVREALSQWSTPERVGAFRLVRDEETAVAAPAKVLTPARWWRAIPPTLLRAAAAILLFAGGAALANLEVRYDKDGIVVRTGWQKASAPVIQVTAQPAQAPTTPAPGPVSLTTSPEGATGNPAPWRAEMAAFQRQLRDEFRQQIAAARAPSASNPTQVAGNVGFDENRVMDRVYKALEESERRQQVDAALRMSWLVSDLQAGRAIDMRRIGADSLPPTLPQQRPKNGMLFDVSIKK